MAFIDIDSMQKRVYGHQKHGAAFGHTKIQGKSLLVRGLNALAATISTPLAAPVIAGTRLRGGNAASARGAASFAAASVGTARATGCTGTLVVRADSAFYSAAFTGAVRRAGAFFSVTVRMDPKVKAAIAAIPETAWTPVRYPRAVWDDQLRCWVSDAEVAEVEYTAFTSKKGQAITARLIVRRVKDLNRKAAAGPGRAVSAPGAITPCSPTPRSPPSRPRSTTATMPRSSRCSRTWPTGPWLTCPLGRSPRTRPGWPAPPSRTTCCAPPGPWPASPSAKARAATLRRDLIGVAARIARHGRGADHPAPAREAGTARPNG